MKQYTSKFAPALESYMQFRTATGFSDHHAKVLHRFDSYCTKFHPMATELTRDVVRGWYEYEVACGFKQLGKKASTIRLFARYLGGDSYILPLDCVPKQPQYVPYILTDEELKRLFNAIDSYTLKEDPFLAQTLSVLYRLIYCCGLRPNEGRNLKTDAINFLTGEIFITKTKRHKERIVVTSEDVLQMLQKYWKIREILSNKSDFFFVHTNGEPLKAYELTKYFKCCWAMANPGLTKTELPRLRVYDLRHRFASAVLQKWLDEKRNLYSMLPYLRAYMGHARFEDTAYYIHLLPDRLISSPGVDWNHIDKIGLGEDIWNN